MDTGLQQSQCGIVQWGVGNGQSGQCRSWSDREIDLIVADYFAMLTDDLALRKYIKAEHNRVLQGQIARSRGSIEVKRQNISAVMLGLGQPWVEGQA